MCIRDRDKADIESVELLVQETDLEKLRTDDHIPYKKNIIDFLKTYKEKYVKAPKMN